MPGRHDVTQPKGLPRVEIPAAGHSLPGNTARLRAIPGHRVAHPPVLPLAHAGDRVLLLQGPHNNFFNYLALHLAHLGATVTKINFNGGDRFFYRGPEAIDFTARPEAFPNYLRELLTSRRINRVFLFGDCRPIHKQAIRICRERGIQVQVFEEGYLRPDYITCEPGGVNGNSSIPKDPAFYRSLPEMSPPPRQPTGSSFFWMAVCLALYFFMCWVDKARYPHYVHHKHIGTLRSHAWCWVISAARKTRYFLRDKLLTKRLAREYSGRYYLVPLQMNDDSQIRHHCHYNNVAEFIRDITASFAEHAPRDTLLVIKHHPLDRGYHHYGDLIAGLSRKHGLEGRLVYTHDIHLPTALDHSRGVVTVNSTVGLSAIWHGAPVKVTGSAVYDIPGLTFQGALKDFWHHNEKPDNELYRRFSDYLIWHCQINASFCGDNPFERKGA